MIHFDPDESVVRTVRRHWFILLISVAGHLFLALLPFIALAMAGYLAQSSDLMPEFSDQQEILYLGGFLYCLWLLLLWIMFFRQWTNYYLDVWYITPKRVVDVEQRGLFNREVISLRYEQLQDITADVAGLLPTLIGYGMIQVQSAGRNRRVILRDAHSPEEVKKLLMKLHSDTLEGVRYRTPTEKATAANAETIARSEQEDWNGTV